MIYKNKKFWFMIIGFILLLGVLGLLLLGVSAKPKAVAKNLNEYIISLRSLSDEFDDDARIHLINHQKEKHFLLKNASYQEVDYASLPSEFKDDRTITASKYIEGQLHISLIMDGIKNHQVKSFLIYCLESIMKYMLTEKYDLTLANMEIVFPEKWQPRFAYFEMTRRLKLALELNQTEQISFAKHYFSLYTEPDGDYNDYEYFQKTWLTLNVEGYSRYLAYRSIYDFKKAKKSVLADYEYSINYHDDIIPKYLEGEYAPIFLFFIDESLDMRKLNLDNSYFEIVFGNIESVMVTDDLHTDLAIKKFYQNYYDQHLNLVGEALTKNDSEAYLRLTLEIEASSINSVSEFTTVNQELFGRNLQVLRADLNLDFDNGAFVFLEKAVVLLEEDLKTISVFIKLSLEEKEKVIEDGFIFSYYNEEDGVRINEVEVFWSDGYFQVGSL